MFKTKNQCETLHVVSVTNDTQHNGNTRTEDTREDPRTRTLRRILSQRTLNRSLSLRTLKKTLSLGTLKVPYHTEP